MAATTINSVPATVIETDVAPTDSILTIDCPMFHKDQAREIVCFITVTVGAGIQFAVGTVVGISNPSFANADGQITLTIGTSPNDEGAKLHFLASAQNDAFIISF